LFNDQVAATVSGGNSRKAAERDEKGRTRWPAQADYRDVREATLESAVETIRGKKALVTGAASGIGRAIALALAREGADLFLVDIDEPGLRICARDAEALGSRVLTEVCDLSEPAQIDACAVACVRSFSALDILVNCAGVLFYGHADEMTAAKWNAVMSVNLLAPIRLVRELLPTLTAQKESHILNVCSVLGLVPVRKLIGYQTTKFALVGFTLALRTEYFAQNVGVTALCPGVVDTPMFQRNGPAWFRRLLSFGPFSLVVSPDFVARQAVAAIRRNRGIVVVSFGGKILWLIFRLCPTLIVWLFRRKP
jgi:3-oxoacyl-[acyl-carrier protein] reductase